MINLNSDNKIRHGLILLFFVVLPFERLLTLDVAGYTLKLSYILGLIIIIYAIVLIAKKHISLTLYRDELWLLLFALLAILTTLWSIDWKRSLIVSLTVIFVLVLFYVLRRIIDPKLKEKIISVFIYMGVLTSLFGIWQFFVDKTFISHFSFLRPEYTSAVFGFPRVQATFLEPLYLANFLLIPIFFSFYRLAKKSSASGYLFLTVTATAFFLALSRGAFLALAVGLLFVAVTVIIYDRSKLTAFLKSVVFTILAGVLAVLSIYAVAGKTGLATYSGHAVVNDVATGESVIDRKYTMDVALDESLLHPFGLGVGAFGALPELRGDIQSQGYQTVNNLYLEILVETGFLGLILFIVFLWNYVLNLIKEFARNKLWVTICLGLVLAILTQYLFFSTIYIIYIWAVLAVLSTKQPKLPNS